MLLEITKLNPFTHLSINIITLFNDFLSVCIADKLFGYRLWRYKIYDKIKILIQYIKLKK
jgi:membrane protein YdbS with pleckstrin-like domain